MQNQDDANMTDSLNTREQQSLWAQNHGNVLMMFLAGLIVLGSAILLYRQSRFVAPRFPQTSLIGDANLLNQASGEGYSQANGFVSLIVTGADQEEGNLIVAVYDSAESFANRANPLMTEQTTLRSGTAELQLPLGDIGSEIAIVAFEDANANGEFDPKSGERIGFSGSLERSEMDADDAFAKAMLQRPFATEALMIELR
ncbi:DUF2141 domain-containing protein [Novipirellula caenicola]|uniref:Uncharacterized protein n=1 Tax=Novipirellula caenicola TaxID=1536901 RepID=A0ABP9VMG4_9BACT